jgi:uncharacterized protein YmfQ (DUF2313 family)
VGLTSPASAAEYALAVQKLLPKGEFWDRQLADPTSDVSLWCQVKAEEIARFEQRRADLARESSVASAVDLLDEWERVAGLNNTGLALDTRRRILIEHKTPNLSPKILSNIASAFGASITRIAMPFRPAVFGHTRFASRLATLGALNVVYLYANLPDEEIHPKFEEAIGNALLASYTTIFFYRTADNEYVP